MLSYRYTHPFKIHLLIAPRYYIHLRLRYLSQSELLTRFRNRWRVGFQAGFIQGATSHCELIRGQHSWLAALNVNANVFRCNVFRLVQTKLRLAGIQYERLLHLEMKGATFESRSGFEFEQRNIEFVWRWPMSQYCGKHNCCKGLF